MSKLFSWFRQNKNKREYSSQSQANVKRRRRHSNDQNELVYVDTGGYIEKQAGNQHRFNGNVGTVYRSEIESLIPQYEEVFKQGTNRQPNSYPDPPEWLSSCQHYSYEQKPSFEIPAKEAVLTEPKTIMNYVCGLEYSNDNLPYGISVENIPRSSTVSQGNNEDIANGGTIYEADKSVQDYFKPGTSKDRPDLLSFSKNNHAEIQRSGQNTYRISKIGNVNFTPRLTGVENKNIYYLAKDNILTQYKGPSKIKAEHQILNDCYTESDVKQMIYCAEDVVNPPKSTRKYVQHKSVGAKQQPLLLKTTDGKTLRPLTSEQVRRLFIPSNKDNAPIKLTVAKPLEENEGFPLAQGGEVFAAPVIGMSRGGRRGGMQPYYNEMYPSYYYDSGYFGEEMGGYGYGPQQNYGKCRGRSRYQVFPANMPGITVPATLFHQKNDPLLVKRNESSHIQETHIKFPTCDVKDDNMEMNAGQLHKESIVQTISTAQQTDDEKELVFTCFSPEKALTSGGLQDHNTDLKWRIIIKREPTGMSEKRI